MAKKTYIDLNNLTLYHNNLKLQLDTRDRTIIEAIGEVSETVGRNIENLQQSVTTLENTTNELYQKSVHIELLNLTLEQQEQARNNINADVDEVNSEYINNLPLPSEVIDTENETITILLSSQDITFDPYNTIINIYYNSSSSVSDTVTVDRNKQVIIKVPLGTKYKLEFPQIQGYKLPVSIVNTALLVWRFLEVEYLPTEGLLNEEVEIICRKYIDLTTHENFPGIHVLLTHDGNTTEYISNEEGKITFDIPIGDFYSFEILVPQGYHLPFNKTVYERTASNDYSKFFINFHTSEVGLFIVDSTGYKCSFEDWKSLVLLGVKHNENAKMIYISTEGLATSNSAFYIDIDDIIARNFSSLAWGSGLNVESTPISGLEATQNILLASRDSGILAPAAEYCYALFKLIGGTSLLGFLGSLVLWEVLWANASIIDDILQTVRINPLNVFSTFTTNKWTSTQSSAANAWVWASTAVNSNGKSSSCSVVPFFA